MVLKIGIQTSWRSEGIQRRERIALASKFLKRCYMPTKKKSLISHLKYQILFYSRVKDVTKRVQASSQLPTVIPYPHISSFTDLVVRFAAQPWNGCELIQTNNVGRWLPSRAVRVRFSKKLELYWGTSTARRLLSLIQKLRQT